MELVFATQNQNKVVEIQDGLTNENVRIKSLKELNVKDELEETQNTLEGNALQKSSFIWEKYRWNVFADDTGLEVEALDGAPGVYSARYAGETKSFRDNMELLLQNMQQHTNRKARFRTVISLILEGERHHFEGICEGEITETPSGEEGFGYDPIFKPNGYSETFAEMPRSLKNSISHRGKAFKNLISFIDSL
ncbi:MAG: non-canonical purine NTP pyrophosphatase, RdgB/HAM1 family [Verrucomicrobia bacterium]|nr:non-canonical purine NTP pyrophosphatase, RdgB/HAM1 family [Verrucomicrobiota bacterium]